jgi:two-component system response regulator YesN
MNVLIVDDQIHVAKGVESGVNWSGLGIEGVFLAHSMREAQQAFAMETIDIIISDIEMPMGSGLDLITWVREQYPQTECIFLTAHEDFDYARTAIKLGSFDYLVQPIQYDELEKVVARAIEKIQLTSRKEALSVLGSYWQDNARNVREGFWANILVGNYPQNAAKLDAQADQLGIEIDSTARYLPVLVNIIRPRSS